jgi:hypothetical protein
MESNLTKNEYISVVGAYEKVTVLRSDIEWVRQMPEP